ncbi:MAG: DNA helicase II [Gammaproteobacteria bacterium]|nr:MAG: DNA helicase II [Gammaproteobacteria bacterium]
MDVSHLLEGLNAPQREAVTSTAPAVMVIAGAGSGKTRVLTHRVSWLIEVERLSPYSILAVTFTNKAAAEMRSRIETQLDMSSRGLWVGTFHGISHRLLRMHWREAGLPQQFQIIDSDDQKRLVKRVIKERDLDPANYPPAQVQWWINNRKDEGLRAANIDAEGDHYLSTMVQLYTDYEAACERGGMVDFAELLLRSNELWLNQPELLKHYQERFAHILVDEFQDTNTLQYAWIRNLAGEHTRMFIVGDDDQAIYGWRGAKVENINRYERELAPVEVIKLEQNYRSTQTILSAANGLITHNHERHGKNLWSNGEEGEPIDLYAAFNEQEEARYVIDQIEEFIAAGGDRDQAAILYRSNAQSRTFEEQLVQRGTPYKVYGGLRFFDRAEVRDGLAYLRLVANRNDDAAFERVVNHPPRGIGGRTLELLRAEARKRDHSLWAVAQDSSSSGLTSRAVGAIQRFCDLIEQIANACNNSSLAEKIETTINQCGLLDHFAGQRSEKEQARVENLEELVNAGNLYQPDEEEADLDPLSTFLSHAALEAGESQGDAWEKCVQLMTLHSAKGLEFDLVFLTGMEEGLFPHSRSIEEPGRLEEERRLCYVGMTRARQTLCLTHAEARRLHGETRITAPSRFVREIPAEYLHEVKMRGQIEAPVYRPGSSLSNAQPTANGLRLGQLVAHAKFGEGVITDIEGDGTRQRVQVEFNTVGSKWLMTDYANLQPA